MVIDITEGTGKYVLILCPVQANCDALVSFVCFVGTARKSSYGKIMFSQACVKNSVHKEGHVRGTHSLPARARKSWAHTHAPWTCVHAPWSHMHAPRHAHTPWACMPPSGYYEMRSMSRRYASYWNAFLLKRFCLVRYETFVT